jgi:DNA-binding transcriptional regulator YiaG
MVVADTSDTVYDTSQINTLMYSDQQSTSYALHCTYERPSPSEIFELISYRTGQDILWKYSKNDFKDILIEQNPTSEPNTAAKVIEPLKTLLNKRISELKLSLDITDEELAGILGASRKTIHNWQQGNTKPNKNKLNRLISQHKLIDIWISNGYPDINNLDAPEKNVILQKLQQEIINTDNFLYFGASLMLTQSAAIIENPFA